MSRFKRETRFASAFVLSVAPLFAQSAFAQKKEPMHFEAIVIEVFRTPKASALAPQTPAPKTPVKDLFRPSFRKALKESASHL